MCSLLLGRDNWSIAGNLHAMNDWGHRAMLEHKKRNFPRAEHTNRRIKICYPETARSDVEQ